MIYPQRIICLAAEIPEILWRLGALDRVVGISAYTLGPPEAMHLPKVSGFRYGSVERIMSFRPDLVILTSNVQQDLAARLGEAGVSILHFHPHRLVDVYAQIRLLGSLVGASARAEEVCAQMQCEAQEVSRLASHLAWRPKVYFEEWMDPLICGTGWISDLIELAGGQDVFRDRSIHGRKVEERRVTAEEVAQADPDLMLVSWCGKPFVREQVRERAELNRVMALRQGEVHEIAGAILQCGPPLMAALREVHQRIADCVRRRPDTEDLSAV